VMKKMLVAILAVLLVAVAVFAQTTAPTVTTPVEGAVLGPNYDIIGSIDHRAFLIVMTDVITDDEAQTVLRSVPGIRHWTATDGTFHFRVASPRVSVGEKDTKLKYKVRVFEATPNGNGPETSVMCQMAPPTE
ncbi:MAG: hypothetical protein WCP21_24360, partial [Armatimonadota bacterium]